VRLARGTSADQADCFGQFADIIIGQAKSFRVQSRPSMKGADQWPVCVRDIDIAVIAPSA